MTTGIADLEILQDPDTFLEEVQERVGNLDQPGTARAVLHLTDDLSTVMDNIGDLQGTGADLAVLRVLGHARAYAARTTGDAVAQLTAAQLAATLSLATGDAASLLDARALMLEAKASAAASEDAQPTAEDAGASPVGGDFFTSAAPTSPFGGSLLAAAPEDAPSTGDSDPRDELRAGALDPSGDDVWDREMRTLGQLADSDPDSAVVRAGELRDMILAARPTAGTVRPVVLHRLFDLHRIIHRNGGASTADAGCEDFLATIDPLIPGDLSATAPLDDRILLNRYRSGDTTADSADRLTAAQRLANLYAEKDDTRGMAESLLQAGEELEKLKRMAEMYDTYQRAFNLAQDTGATDIRIWATIRLAFAQYVAGDKRTATQMLLDQDEELTESQLTGEKEIAAMAQAKVALANLFGEAGDTDGRDLFSSQAADLFERIGDTASAASYRPDSSKTP
ncbi:MAG: hypothetical protein ACTH1D_01710 [Mycobacteriaceae bacterium]|uniref:hypothetical protein n=1 Tax=Corynebacterium variabile TaxID=1727 RepID=UPI003FB69E0D